MAGAGDYGVGTRRRDDDDERVDLIDNVPAILAHFDRDLRCRFANKRYAEFFGFEPGGVANLHLREIIGDLSYQRVEGHFRQVFAGHPVSYQRMDHLPDGECRCLEVKLVPSFSGRGQVIGCHALATDISEQKRTERSLRDAMAQLRLFADSIPAMTVSYDAGLRCRFVNKRFAEFMGVDAEEAVGLHMREIFGESIYRLIEPHFARALTGQPVTYHRHHSCANGELRHIEVKLLPDVGEVGDIKGCFAVTTDVTDYKQAEARIWQVAHYDALTALPNRLLFTDRLNQAISLAKRDCRELALLYLDLDRFKPVNDELGHDAGDLLLRQVADRIRLQLRESDTAARVGGDEFAVILPESGDRDSVATVAGKIIAALSAPFALDGGAQDVGIGASIGIALYPGDGQDQEALIKAADGAMYAAKEHRNCFRFS